MIKEQKLWIWHSRLNSLFRSIITLHNVIDSPPPLVCRWASNSLKFFHLQTSQVISWKPLFLTENAKLHGNISWVVSIFVDIQAWQQLQTNITLIGFPEEIRHINHFLGVIVHKHGKFDFPCYLFCQTYDCESLRASPMDYVNFQSHQSFLCFQ